jgi:2-alkyl-3-oxoalkanoate reductase
MKVLITGASGFLGGHLVDHALAAGDSVRVILRANSDSSNLTQHVQRTPDRIEIVRGDLVDAAIVNTITRDIDVIYHSAGRVTDEGSYAQFYDANVLATRHLVDAAKVNRVPRFVFVSSPSIFTDYQDHLGMDETVPYPEKYANYYAHTKALSEQYVLAANSADLLTCSLRPRGIWGPRDRAGFMPKLTSALARGKLKNLAPGKAVQASICHVQNIADACLAAARSDKVAGQAYFIADAQPVLVWDLIDRVTHLFGLPPVTGEVNPRLLAAVVFIFETLWKIPALKHHYSPPISRYGASMLTLHSTYKLDKAKRDFGYAPQMDLDTGLRLWKQWVDQNGGLAMLNPAKS